MPGSSDIIFALKNFILTIKKQKKWKKTRY